MRIFAAISPHDSSPRSAVPAEILRRLAFGRPQAQPVRPVMPTAPASAGPAVSPAPLDETLDLAQRVRQSGEW